MSHRNQHWIPRSYLKEWCDPDHKDRVVHRYNRDGSYADWRPPSRVFSSDDLYTVHRDGERDVEVETGILKPIEDLFLKTRDRLEQEPRVTSGVKSAMAFFVAAMRNRSPAARDHWQDFKDRIVRAGDEMAAALARATPAARAQMVEGLRSPVATKGDGISLDEARAAAKEPFGRWLPRHILLEARLLERMTLTVLKAPAGIGFITSDSPVVWHDTAHRPGDRPRRIGLGYKYIEVSMPISPSMCLMFDHSQQEGVAEINQGAVDNINSRTLGHCDAFFIANSRDLAVDWIDETPASRTDSPHPQ